MRISPPPASTATLTPSGVSTGAAGGVVLSGAVGAAKQARSGRSVSDGRGAAAPGPGTGGAGPLGTSRTVLHPPHRGRRADRAALRENLREVSLLKRLRRCGHTAVDGQGVMVRCTSTPDGPRAGFAGLATCGSVWACPVCAAKIAAERSAELVRTLEAVQAQGYRAALMTFTVRHSARHALRDVWGAVTRGWGRVTSGKGWKSDQSRYGLGGWARAVEVTHGANGWHVHVHAVVVYRGTVQEGHDLGWSMWRRWLGGIERAGFTAVAGSGGFDVQVSEGGELGALGKYLAKQGADLDGLAAEAVTGQFKQGRKGNRTPFQIARDVFTSGDADDLDLWHEWERVSKGRRQLTWSKSLRELADLEDERTDEEIAADETGTADDDVVLLPAETWRAVRSTSWLLLDRVESEGRAGLVAWLDACGYAWHVPPSQRQ